MHPRIVSIFILVSMLIGGLTPHLSAQNEPVTVSNTKFYSKEGSYDDYLFEIELTALAPTEASVNPKYLDNIEVEVIIGYPHPIKAGEFLFHKSTVAIATMEVKQKRKIGFWLPYDIAQRDNMNKEPEFWLINLSVDGSEIPLTGKNSRNRTSSNLTSKQAVDKMMSLASSATEGVLLPGYLSGNGYRERGRDRPPFIRIEEN